MKLAPILPATSCYLTQSQEYHMAVAPVLMHNDRYYQHFKALGQLEGRYIILDNGAWESETVPASQLVKMGEEIRAGALIIPDVFKDGAATKKLYDANILYLRANWRGHLLAVPQGKTFREWRSCVKYFAQRDFDMWALPKVTEVLFREDGMRDAAAREILELDPYRRPIHYLGIWSNPIEMWVTNQDKELLPYIKGVDSKVFYRLAKSGIALDPVRGLLDNHKPPRHMKFDDPRLDEPQNWLLQWNLYCGFHWVKGAIPEWEKFKETMVRQQNALHFAKSLPTPA